MIDRFEHRYPPPINNLVSTPVRRRLAFLGIVLAMATIATIEFRYSFGVYHVESCIPKPSCVDTHNVQVTWQIAGWAFKATLVSAATGLAIRIAFALGLVNDCFRSARFKNPIALRNRLGAILFYSRRVTSLITIIAFASVVLLSIGLVMLVPQ